MSDYTDEDIFLPNGQLRPDAVDAPMAQALDEALCFTRATNWDSVRTPCTGASASRRRSRGRTGRRPKTA